MSGKILVVGATGTVGRHLVAALVAKGETVKAASRTPVAIAGAESVAFDFADPAPALDGVDRLYLLSPTGHLDPVGLLTPVITEAARRKIKIVLQTAIGVDADDNIPLRQVELAVERSGVPFVILRPNWFADNFETYWKGDILNGAIRVPAGDGASSFVDARDIADSAAGALTTDRFDGQAFALTGPEAVSYGQAAELLSGYYGRTISYQPIDDETFVAAMIKAGLSEGYAGFLAIIFHPVREGWTAGVTDAVETLSGHAPRSLEQWARDNLKASVAG
ncbi:hypothetical protein ABAC460_23265 [Asticcacaulis sp. AC460]|uniref:SDR family oxidoreductase n=1 Tax=Asticcacaulis sp. AC460 TaxID=1282360 RepID=UPI0003C3FAA5|nr:SDR family oxidoreductase [Asticcacaulis sp. AC460]ESQ86524.1 hypothetical protein ABAC460_23265 [Asticcacaulis sp. AC460]